MKRIAGHVASMLFLLTASFSFAQSLSDNEIEVAPGAPLKRDGFLYSREIPESAAGWTSLALDAAVLANSRRDLGDLRISDSKDRQIQYLLEKTSGVMRIELRPIPENESRKSGASAKESRYQIELPFENLPAAKLVLVTDEKTFRRDLYVKVQHSEEGRSSDGWSTIAQSNWSHINPDSDPDPLVLDIPNLAGTRRLLLVVDEGDNSALPIKESRLELPEYQLRFFYPQNEKLTLLYGQKGLEAPHYDLSILAHRLAGMPSHNMSLPAAIAAPAQTGNLQAQLFWGALIVAVIGIFALLVKLLRSAPKPG